MITAARSGWNARGALLDEINGPPQPAWPPDAPAETSRWLPGSMFVEQLALTLPREASTGDYEVKLKLYFWEDLALVAAPDLGPEGTRQILTVKVRSY